MRPGQHLRALPIAPHTIAFGVLLVVFIWFKIGFLDQPYYWDEAWVYAPAVGSMHENGVGILPSNLAPDLSRGHPLLFHATAALWAGAFGFGQVSMHSFALFLSCALLLSVYAFGVRIGSRAIGLASVILVGLNEAFLAQSALLLPEIMLALCTVLAMLFYITRNGVAFFVAALAGLMTKEAAVVMIVGLTFWQSIRLARSWGTEERRREIRWLLIVLSPLIPTILYFVLQYKTYGWFLFPEHIGLLTWSSQDVVYKARVIFTVLFEDQGALVLTYTFALITSLIWTGIPKWRRALVALLFVASIKALWGRWPIPFLPEWMFPLICLGLVLPLLMLPLWRQHSLQGEVVAVLFIFTIGYWSFTALNFYTDRYLISMVPVIAIGASTFMFTVFKQIDRRIFPALVLIVSLPFLVSIGKDDKVGDTKLNYSDSISTFEDLVAFAGSEGMGSAPTWCSFMDAYYLTDPRAGYVTSPLFEQASDQLTPNTVFAIMSNATGNTEVEVLRSNGFMPFKRFEKGAAWYELLTR